MGRDRRRTCCAGWATSRACSFARHQYNEYALTPFAPHHVANGSRDPDTAASISTASASSCTRRPSPFTAMVTTREVTSRHMAAVNGPQGLAEGIR